MKQVFVAVVCGLFAASAQAQTSSQEQPTNVAAPKAVFQAGATLPTVASNSRTAATGTLLVVTPMQEVSSKHAEKGDAVEFNVVNDVVENGVVAIPRGTPVKGTVTWKTGRAVGGKSGKFEITFNSLFLNGKTYALRGTHRQEGRGNTVGALLGSIIISGRSAVMLPGQLINIFTAEPVLY